MRLIVFSILLCGASATAGQVAFRDGARILSADQQDILRSAAARWPFRLRVLTGSYLSRGDLERDVSSCVVAPDIVCTGIDPGHRFTSTHFGTATGVRPSEYNSIAAAGNPRFKEGAWAAGVETIADRALESIKSAQQPVVHVEVKAPPASAPVVVVQPQSTPVVPAAQTQSSSTSGWWWVLGFLAFGGLVWAVVALSRRQKKLDRDMGSYREERDEYMNKNVDRMTRPVTTAPRRTSPAPRAAAPAPASSVVQQSTVVVVDSSPAPIFVPVPAPREPARRRDDTPVPSHDSGGGSSSWSSFDGGGGGSDF